MISSLYSRLFNVLNASSTPDASLDAAALLDDVLRESFEELCNPFSSLKQSPEQNKIINEPRFFDQPNLKELNLTPDDQKLILDISSSFNIPAFDAAYIATICRRCENSPGVNAEITATCCIYALRSTLLHSLFLMSRSSDIMMSSDHVDTDSASIEMICDYLDRAAGKGLVSNLCKLLEEGSQQIASMASPQMNEAASLRCFLLSDEVLFVALSLFHLSGLKFPSMKTVILFSAINKIESAIQKLSSITKTQSTQPHRTFTNAFQKPENISVPQSSGVRFKIPSHSSVVDSLLCARHTLVLASLRLALDSSPNMAGLTRLGKKTTIQKDARILDTAEKPQNFQGFGGSFGGAPTKTNASEKIQRGLLLPQHAIFSSLSFCEALNSFRIADSLATPVFPTMNEEQKERLKADPNFRHTFHFVDVPTWELSRQDSKITTFKPDMPTLSTLKETLKVERQSLEILEIFAVALSMISGDAEEHHQGAELITKDILPVIGESLALIGISLNYWQSHNAPLMTSPPPLLLLGSVDSKSLCSARSVLFPLTIPILGRVLGSALSGLLLDLEGGNCIHKHGEKEKESVDFARAKLVDGIEDELPSFPLSSFLLYMNPIFNCNSTVNFLGEIPTFPLFLSYLTSKVHSAPQLYACLKTLSMFAQSSPESSLIVFNTMRSTKRFPQEMTSPQWRQTQWNSLSLNGSSVKQIEKLASYHECSDIQTEWLIFMLSEMLSTPKMTPDRPVYQDLHHSTVEKVFSGREDVWKSDVDPNFLESHWALLVTTAGVDLLAGIVKSIQETSWFLPHVLTIINLAMNRTNTLVRQKLPMSIAIHIIHLIINLLEKNVLSQRDISSITLFQQENIWVEILTYGLVEEVEVLCELFSSLSQREVMENHRLMVINKYLVQSFETLQSRDNCDTEEIPQISSLLLTAFSDVLFSEHIWLSDIKELIVDHVSGDSPFARELLRQLCESAVSQIGEISFYHSGPNFMRWPQRTIKQILRLFHFVLKRRVSTGKGQIPKIVQQRVVLPNFAFSSTEEFDETKLSAAVVLLVFADAFGVIRSDETPSISLLSLQIIQFLLRLGCDVSSLFSLPSVQHILPHIGFNLNKTLDHLEEAEATLSLAVNNQQLEDLMLYGTPAFRVELFDGVMMDTFSSLLPPIIGLIKEPTLILSIPIISELTFQILFKLLQSTPGSPHANLGSYLLCDLDITTSIRESILAFYQSIGPWSFENEIPNFEFLFAGKWVLDCASAALFQHFDAYLKKRLGYELLSKYLAELFGTPITSILLPSLEDLKKKIDEKPSLASPLTIHSLEGDDFTSVSKCASVFDINPESGSEVAQLAAIFKRIVFASPEVAKLDKTPESFREFFKNTTFLGKRGIEEISTSAIKDMYLKQKTHLEFDLDTLLSFSIQANLWTQGVSGQCFVARSWSNLCSSVFHVAAAIVRKKTFSSNVALISTSLAFFRLLFKPLFSSNIPEETTVAFLNSVPTIASLMIPLALEISETNSVEVELVKTTIETCIYSFSERLRNSQTHALVSSPHFFIALSSVIQLIHHLGSRYSEILENELLGPEGRYCVNSALLKVTDFSFETLTFLQTAMTTAPGLVMHSGASSFNIDGLKKIVGNMVSPYILDSGLFGLLMGVLIKLSASGVTYALLAGTPIIENISQLDPFGCDDSFEPLGTLAELEVLSTKDTDMMQMEEPVSGFNIFQICQKFVLANGAFDNDYLPLRKYKLISQHLRILPALQLVIAILDSSTTDRSLENAKRSFAHTFSSSSVFKQTAGSQTFPQTLRGSSHLTPEMRPLIFLCQRSSRRLSAILRALKRIEYPTSSLPEKFLPIHFFLVLLLQEAESVVRILTTLGTTVDVAGVVKGMFSSLLVMLANSTSTLLDEPDAPVFTTNRVQILRLLRACVFFFVDKAALLDATVSSSSGSIMYFLFSLSTFLFSESPDGVSDVERDLRVEVLEVSLGLLYERLSEIYKKNHAVASKEVGLLALVDKKEILLLPEGAEDAIFRLCELAARPEAAVASEFTQTVLAKLNALIWDTGNRFKPNTK
eukprot:gnl/Chilomastix_cuspidata/4138.p1 GENE.gnl/Chilomastix_cuspidata/4138~~gnl/Chilomastix_cuspidata/4138.p1  ORF type:complete len:2048 (+),score=129.69 gnl/Chilomastix_cuspidata/4138:96-6239(+)